MKFDSIPEVEFKYLSCFRKSRGQELWYKAYTLSDLEILSEAEEEFRKEENRLGLIKTFYLGYKIIRWFRAIAPRSNKKKIRMLDDTMKELKNKISGTVEKYLEEERTLPDADFYMSICIYNIGLTQESENIMLALLKNMQKAFSNLSNENRFKLYGYLAFINLERGKFKEAIEYYTRAINDRFTNVGTKVYLKNKRNEVVNALRKKIMRIQKKNKVNPHHAY